ncbi:alpha/beta hydrolase [Nocardioides sp. 1609]|uniref:alpha/beta fold hydrolase n=1 Tax=Nocardioides sp. 1609 TaxID=2508327 RepID=UPI00106F4ABF|nr:alpha/beta hydrolase [Nocardioides sp. 1609]
MRKLAVLSVAALVAGLLSTGPSRADDPPGRSPGAGAPSSSSAPAARVSADEAQVARAPLPDLAWKKCPFAREIPKEKRARVTCATPRVPLDYDDPRGATTKLGIVKVAAAQPGRRIGSLFVNPGGPGGSSAGFAVDAGATLGKDVDARFDVIGIDPRGVGGSGRTTCRGTIRVPGSFFGFPVGSRQARQQIRSDDSVRRACRQQSSALLDHASTADVARDMELVRRALREPRISYYGISYGSYLGSTYAAMFPDNIRALVVDGVLDPVAWSTGGPGKKVTHPFSYRIGSGKGAYEALTAAWTECDRVGPTRCELAPASLAKWQAVVRAARQGRLTLDGEPWVYQDIVGFGLSALYDPLGPRYFAPFVAELYAELTAAARGTRDRRVDVSRVANFRVLADLRRALDERGPYAAPALSSTTLPSAAARPSTVDLVFQAVTCSDGRNPQSPAAWERSAKLADRVQPWFGRSWTWASSLCAKEGVGDGSDSFRGPWQTSTSYPLLVVGNSHDPATPVRGARKVNSLFRDSVFTQYDAWGHGALGGGACISRTMADYLVHRTLPPDGRVCPPARPLYRR